MKEFLKELSIQPIKNKQIASPEEKRQAIKDLIYAKPGLSIYQINGVLGLSYNNTRKIILKMGKEKKPSIIIVPINDLKVTYKGTSGSFIFPKDFISEEDAPRTIRHLYIEAIRARRKEIMQKTNV